MKKLLPIILALILLLTACAPAQVENKPFELTYQDVVYSGTYTGSMKDKLPNGEGSFTFEDGGNVLKYTGTWSEGKMSGAGKLTDSQFHIKFTEVDRQGHYEGDTENGVPKGNGTFTATNDNGDKYTYIGDFSNGTFDGLGARRFEEFSNYDEVGTFTVGDFTPTQKEIFAYLGQADNAHFSIRALPSEFLSTHAEVFTSNVSEGLDTFVDTEYQILSYTKSPDKFGDKLIKQTSLKITQISEYPAFNYDAITFILAADANYNYYYIFYLGSADVYVGDNISAYLLPLDYFTFDNVAGGQTWAVACAAAYISK